MDHPEPEDDRDRGKSVIQHVKDITLAPFHILMSPVFLRTYLQTILLLLTSTLLFGIAVTAYTSFYYAYIPIRGIKVPVYLQYDARHQFLPQELPQGPTRHERHPYGIANVQGLISKQKYDVIVEMDIPRSEKNLGTGNWMVGVEMRGSQMAGGAVKSMLEWEAEWDVEDSAQHAHAGSTTDKVTTSPVGGMIEEKAVVLARSRRPAILTYRSWTIEHAYRFLRLPFYVLGFGLESEKVEISMMEGVVFEKGWRNVPSSLRLEVRSRQPLEVYSVAVRFVARLEGLRWAMYTHRIVSAMVFISVFWGVGIGVVLLTWAAFSICFNGAESSHDEEYEGGRQRMKKEGSGPGTPKAGHAGEVEADTSAPPTPLSDTSRTFPTLSSQKPLHYTSPNEGKWKEEGTIPRLEDVPVKEEEADDEEDDDFLLEEPVGRAAELDSGIGTSLESSVEMDRGVSRRRSGRGLGKREK